MRSLKTLAFAVITLGLLIAPDFAQDANAQSPVLFTNPADNVAGFASAVNGSTAASSCALIKWVGSATGKPTVAVAAGGDMTLSTGAGADTTTGSPSLNGVYDLSTPAAAVDTMGELVNLVNTTGSNWRMVLTGCLASDFTDNTIDTLATTDASSPQGVTLFRDSVVVNATSTFAAQVALYPEDAATNIRFHLSGGPVGNTTGSVKVNPNPLSKHQYFVQHIRERITSTGTIGLLEVLGVKRTYDTTGKVSETVRTLYAETGAATTVEKIQNFHNGPIVAAPGELVVLRQRTGTDLTVISVNGSGYAIVRP